MALIIRNTTNKVFTDASYSEQRVRKVLVTKIIVRDNKIQTGGSIYHYKA